MRAGDLSHRVVIQIPQRSKNTIGEWVTTWITWATVWAAIEPDTGRQNYQAKQINAEADGRIRIRYRYGLEPTMRVSYQGRIYQILSIIAPKQAKDDLIIIYKEALD